MLRVSFFVCCEIKITRWSSWCYRPILSKESSTKAIVGLQLLTVNCKVDGKLAVKEWCRRYRRLHHHHNIIRRRFTFTVNSEIRKLSRALDGSQFSLMFYIFFIYYFLDCGHVNAALASWQRKNWRWVPIPWRSWNRFLFSESCSFQIKEWACPIYWSSGHGYWILLTGDSLNLATSQTGRSDTFCSSTVTHQTASDSKTWNRRYLRNQNVARQQLYWHSPLYGTKTFAGHRVNLPFW